MNEDLSSSIDKVNFTRWTNKAINAKNDIARAFFEFALILKQIKDSGHYDYKYNNFKDYCDSELNIDTSTAYDYIKIADFVVSNNDVLSIEKAQLLGHKKLKLLAQKLNKIEDKYRKSILKNVSENESFTVLKEKVEKWLTKL